MPTTEAVPGWKVLILERMPKALLTPFQAFQGLCAGPDGRWSTHRFVTVMATGSLSYATIVLTHAVAKCALEPNIPSSASPKTELATVVSALSLLVGYVYNQGKGVAKASIEAGVPPKETP